jgi:hypothetical protein
MALLTSTTTYRESLGSLTLLIVPLTGSTTTDTYVVASTLQVLSYWAQPNIGTTSTSVIDVTYVASTGTFTFNTITNDGVFTLFILART